MRRSTRRVSGEDREKRVKDRRNAYKTKTRGQEVKPEERRKEQVGGISKRRITGQGGQEKRSQNGPAGDKRERAR